MQHLINSKLFMFSNPLTKNRENKEERKEEGEMPVSLNLHRITNNNPAPAVISYCNKQSKTVWRVHDLHPSVSVPDDASHYHTHYVGPNQCCAAVVQAVAAPVASVWSFLRRFDNPQAYKHFLRSCQVIAGDGDVGTLREVHVVSGLPAGWSTERLEILDDGRHVISFSIVDGDHRLNNYRSVTTLHVSPSGEGTVVVESFVVDVPPGNTKDETCVFVDTIVRCNLRSLARIAEKSATIRSHI